MNDREDLVFRLSATKLAQLQEMAPKAVKDFKERGTHKGRRPSLVTVVEGWTAEIATRRGFGLPATLPPNDWDGGYDVTLPDGTRIAVKSCATRVVKLRFSKIQGFKAICAAAILWVPLEPGVTRFQGWITRSLWLACLEEGLVKERNNGHAVLYELHPQWLDHRWSLRAWAAPHLNPGARPSAGPPPHRSPGPC
ncbi:MAG: hypothetical protein ACYSUN_11315 [Planctomycetota bacterium]